MAYSDKPVILVVEDSRVLAKVIEQRLSPFFRVELAHDGEEALRMLESTPYAAVVLDLVLPKVDGFEVLRRLRKLSKRIPVVIATAKPRQAVEPDVADLDVEAIFSKPLDFGILTDTLQQAIAKSSVALLEEAETNMATGKKYPFRVARKCCFICGFEGVAVFQPVKDGYNEDWSRGSFPQFHSRNGYEEFDLLKILVIVCPYCFFASSDPSDFADGKDSAYPFSEESKKILARSISIRKRLVPEALDVDPRFDNPHRDRDTVMYSLILAEKCSNGLILAGKPGAYCQAGVFTTLQGALNYSSAEKFYREGLTSFENQLKHKESPRRVLVRTYFFCIVLNMLLNRTVVGRDIMKKVEELYADARYEEISEEEREWLMRINLIWKNGCGSGAQRDIV
ncbi:MAG TPA: response regulator [Fibrobacteria bacterium]|nr:response regulator [Fibrobacteria bacterium]